LDLSRRLLQVNALGECARSESNEDCKDNEFLRGRESLDKKRGGPPHRRFPVGSTILFNTHTNQSEETLHAHDNRPLRIS